jgi:putative FmdB family regulatory protein
MPIYEFHCEQCGKDSELLVQSTDWQGTQCPHCGSAKLTKKLSVFASTSPGSDQSSSCCGPSTGPSSCCCCGG